MAWRLSQFRHTEVDFEGFMHIGHGFADELFRVLAPQASSVEMVPINMCAGVAAVVTSVAA